MDDELLTFSPAPGLVDTTCPDAVVLLADSAALMPALIVPGRAVAVEVVTAVLRPVLTDRADEPVADEPVAPFALVLVARLDALDALATCAVFRLVDVAATGAVAVDTDRAPLTPMLVARPRAVTDDELLTLPVAPVETTCACAVAVLSDDAALVPDVIATA